MQEASIQINPKASLTVRHVGEEQTPLIIIDDFALDTGDVIEYACGSVDYGPDFRAVMYAWFLTRFTACCSRSITFQTTLG